MSESLLSREVALRIGLAARELPEPDAGGLLRVIEELVGLPPSAGQLESLKIKDLASAAEGIFAEIEPEILKRVIARLRGEGGYAEQLPEPEPPLSGVSGDAVVRVACASNQGEMLDGHFGSCKRFLIYELAAGQYRLAELRDAGSAPEDQDKNDFRARLISDCQVLMVNSIGGPAAAKVIRANVHPVKKPEVGPAREEVARLAEVVGRQPPPWLAKVLGIDPEERIRISGSEA